MSRYTCGFPPCKAKSGESKSELKQQGWTFARDGEVMCPTHATIQSLFPRGGVKDVASDSQ